ncbi:MAG: HAD family phosphatase [Woeseiaceae bacterium]|nr:HAD family phosphatase [Woeseiaceae bacterium]
MNIVFDLGGVVVNWQPGKLVSSVFDDTETQQLVRKQIIEHADWLELDRGCLGLDRAINRGAARTGLPSEDIEKLFQAVPPSLTPIEATIELVHELSRTPHSLFVLSNMHLASIAYLEQHHTFWGVFDGIVISSRVNKVKPEIPIYEHLLDRFQLEPGDTVFIDDLEENLTAASSVGIQTIRFRDTAQCRRALVNLGCL